MVTLNSPPLRIFVCPSGCYLAFNDLLEDHKVGSAKKATGLHARALSNLIGKEAFRTAGGVCSQQFCTLVDLNALCELDLKLALKKGEKGRFSDSQLKKIKISRPTMKFCREVLPAHVSSIQVLMHSAAA